MCMPSHAIQTSVNCFKVDLTSFEVTTHATYSTIDPSQCILLFVHYFIRTHNLKQDLAAYSLNFSIMIHDHESMLKYLCK